MTEQNRELIELFFKLNKMMMRYQFINFKNHGPYGNPERGQGRVLSILKMKPEITQKELAYILDMRNQSLGELLTKLEDKELVTREHSQSDKRVMIVKITERGKETADSVKDMGNEIEKLFGCLEKDEQENLKNYLTKIIEGAEDIMPDIDEETMRHMHGKFKHGPHRGGGRGHNGHGNPHEMKGPNPFMGDFKKNND